MKRSGLFHLSDRIMVKRDYLFNDHANFSISKNITINNDQQKEPEL